MVRAAGQWIVLGIFFCVASLTACQRSPGGASSQGEEKVVNLAIWSNYVSPELLAEFEKRTGIRVQTSFYSSNEELLAKLQAGASGYDVIVPSDYMILAMVHLDLIRELDRSKLPHASSLDPKYLNKAFDPGNKRSLPYDWGTTGIAVNRKLYKGKIRSWKDLFEQPELAGKVTLLDDVRETLGAALKALGHGLNTRDPDKVEQAKALLLKSRGRIKAFTSEPLMALVNGETAVAHAYMTEALKAGSRTDGAVEYVVPEEGATLWIDNLAIPSTARHVDNAHRLIDFLLEGKSNAATVMSMFVGPANRDAYALLPPEIRSNPVLFPPPGVKAKLEMMEDLGEAMALWDRAWTEVKAGAE